LFTSFFITASNHYLNAPRNRIYQPQRHIDHAGKPEIKRLDQIHPLRRPDSSHLVSVGLRIRFGPVDGFPHRNVVGGCGLVFEAAADYCAGRPGPENSARRPHQVRQGPVIARQAGGKGHRVGGY